jgi:2-methylisocitrate lyase-like PEP mutase family enzyme
MIQTQAQKAERLRSLHHGERPLILVNAWDVASARVVAELGFPALATSSAGVAASLGYADEEQISREMMLEAVRRIAESVVVPVTADLEAGYGPSAEDAAATARGAIAAGAVGLNFEDGTHDAQAPLTETALQCERIRAIRRVADELGVPLVINARIDTYLRLGGSAEEKESETIRRAHAYIGAGADSVYPIMVSDEGAIARLVQAIPAPVNALCAGDAPPLEKLAALGVRRISYGARPLHVAMNALRDLAIAAKPHGLLAE